MAFNTNEFVGNQERTIKDAIDGALLSLWSCCPCIVVSYDPDALTVELQPTIRSSIMQPDGSMQRVNMPLLLDVPVLFTRGGGCTITHPIKPGDECIAVFADRCIDAWWQSGGVQNPMENRSHDLSDAFAIFAPQSQPTKINNVSTTALQIRSDDGQAFIELDPTSHNVSITTPATAAVQAETAAVTATTVNITGSTNVTVNTETAAINASVSATVTAPSISLGAAGQALKALVTSVFTELFNGHQHTSTTPGSLTSPPTQQMGDTHITSTVKGG